MEKSRHTAAGGGGNGPAGRSEDGGRRENLLSVQEGHGGWAWRRRNCGSWLSRGSP